MKVIKKLKCKLKNLIIKNKWPGKLNLKEQFFYWFSLLIFLK